MSKPLRIKSARVVEGLSSASVKTGIPVDVLKRMKALGCDAFEPGNRIDPKKAREWFAANSEKLKVQGEILNLKDQKTNEEIRKLKIANDAKEKLVIARLDVAAKARELGDKCTALLYAKLVNEYPATLSNDVTSNRVMGQALANALIAEIRGFGAIWET